MNLYWVQEKEAEWGVYVFAKTRNKARYMLPDYSRNELEYISTTAKFIGKTDDVKTATVVEDEGSPLYPIVKSFGYRYTDENGEMLE